MQKEEKKNQMHSVTSNSKDIHLPTNKGRYERPSLLEVVLNKKLKVNIGNSNIDRILQANSDKPNSKVDLMIITELSRHAHISSAESLSHKLKH